MDLPLLLAAVERGDDDAVLELLHDTTADDLAGADAVALLAAAARAGRHQVVYRLAPDMDATRSRDGGVDLVTWAAENGWYWVLQALLSRHHDPLSPDSPHRHALRTAQQALASGTGADTDPPPPTARSSPTWKPHSASTAHRTN